MSYQFDPRARRELEAAADHYLEEGGPRPAFLFVAAVERAVRLLAAMPSLGTPAFGSTRLWLVKRFPYTLVYREEAHGISVIAVAHQRREPGYWRGRG